METQKQILDEWYRRVAVTQAAHYYSADHFGARKYWLGIPTVVLTTLVGTSVFATVQKQPEPWLQISVGLARAVGCGEPANRIVRVSLRA